MTCLMPFTTCPGVGVGGWVVGVLDEIKANSAQLSWSQGLVWLTALYRII